LRPLRAGVRGRPIARVPAAAAPRRAAREAPGRRATPAPSEIEEILTGGPRRLLGGPRGNVRAGDADSRERYGCGRRPDVCLFNAWTLPSRRLVRAARRRSGTIR